VRPPSAPEIRSAIDSDIHRQACPCSAPKPTREKLYKLFGLGTSNLEKTTDKALHEAGGKGEGVQLTPLEILTGKGECVGAATREIDSRGGACPPVAPEAAGARRSRRLARTRARTHIPSSRCRYKGLVTMIMAYLETIGTDTLSLSTVTGYLDFIVARASGELMTPAAWMRKFIRSHPDYKHDSVISPRIAADLMVSTAATSRLGARRSGLGGSAKSTHGGRFSAGQVPPHRLRARSGARAARRAPHCAGARARWAAGASALAGEPRV
jgi:hypothetical protein